ncbi:MAG: L-aspartate oxidase [Deltaproteobacteria bacterium]|nr:L-aspartate oxidase [Deltaproteobacteria bacterium]
MPQISDHLILGSGLAALSYALEASRRGESVVIATKRAASEANTAYAQGGIAAVLTPEDSFDAHVTDTLEAGAGLCRRDVVERIVKEAPLAIERLVRAGVRFDRTREHELAEDGAAPFDLGREGGHSARRILHSGDVTGREIQRGLLDALARRPGVTILEEHCAVDLITRRKVQSQRGRTERTQDRCLGAYVLDVGRGRVETFLATSTLIATGGASKVYLYTTNPDVATGDGIAMAWRAGAEVSNMEFIQFHPTCLYHPAAKSFLISEAVRGEGGILRRQDGTPFMASYHPMKDLAPRDVVARAIDSELKRTGDDYVVLDTTHLSADFMRQRFPTIHEKCLSFGIDLTREPIPVVPAAHYVCGGVRTDRDGASSIRGLFVAGESACTGLHGANRLASNSLLEAAVMGHAAAEASAQLVKSGRPELSDVAVWDAGNAVPSDELVVITQCWDEIRRFMWNYVGIVRSDRRLLRALRRIETIKEEIRDFYFRATVTRDLLELRNIATVAELIVLSALRRKESRGLHYTIDYPRLGHEAADTILWREDLV